jgi:hypothetical protein
MLRHLATLLVASVLVAVVVPTSAVAASRQDISAARNALTAGYTALSAVIRTWPRVEASMRRLDRRFATECPAVGAGSPQSDSEQRLSYEVAGALWATGYHTDAPIIRKFIHKVTGLTSSNRTLNRRFYKFLNGLSEMIALPVPDICADVRAWTASGYRTIPASTLQFDKHVEAIEVKIPSPRLAEPYLVPSDRGLVPKLEHLITRFDELEFSTGQRYWNVLLETLSLNQ